MGITNEGSGATVVNGASGGASNYSPYHMMNGNGIAEKAIKACKDPAHAKSVVNFNPGPAKIAPSVLAKAQEEMVVFRNHGISVMEMSHRSAEFMSILNGAKEALTQLLNIPENYKILFLQGGASAQFSAVPLNLLQRSSDLSADYIVTGTWSNKAVKEAEKYGNVRIAHQKFDKYTRVPTQGELQLNPNAAYVYYCDNETVHGVEFPYIPDTGDVPLVVDMSSNILSRPFDVSKFGIILAGAQKNIGCAGVTLAIIREDLVGHSMKYCPSVLDYKVQVGMNSMFNTPPSYSIYIMGLVLEWIKECGGLQYISEKCSIKSEMIYSLMDESNGFYCCSADKGSRSRMNVTFRIGGVDGDPALEEAFVAETKAAHMLGLKGHRSVGGIRASLYNAVTVEETQKLAELMKNFHVKHFVENVSR